MVDPINGMLMPMRLWIIKVNTKREIMKKPDRYAGLR